MIVTEVIYLISPLFREKNVMQYKIKITQVCNNVPSSYFYKVDDIEKIYPHYNHASYDCKELIKNGDTYGELVPFKTYYMMQSDVVTVLEIVPLLETSLPQYFNDNRGREWETFCDLSYYDMICVRPKGDKDFNSQLSFHFSTTEDASLFVQLLKEAN